jgi:hypothetical protein
MNLQGTNKETIELRFRCAGSYAAECHGRCYHVRLRANLLRNTNYSVHVSQLSFSLRREKKKTLHSLGRQEAPHTPECHCGCYCVKLRANLLRHNSYSNHVSPFK